MQRRISFLAAAAIFAVGASISVAQNADSAAPAGPGYTQSQPAPIERAYPNQQPYGQYSGQGRYNHNGAYGRSMTAQANLSPGSTVSATNIPLSAAPIPGVIVRIAPDSSVNEVSSSADRLELRVESGIVNVNVHDPQKDVLLLVDLPGGQTQMLKNGLYTFNAATNTARVLKGEALAFLASAANAEPLKIKEYNKIEYGKDTKPHEFIPQQAVADLIPSPRGSEPNGNGTGYGRGYGYGPYGDGYYGYPYGFYPGYGYSPYWSFAGPWGYPYGFYPGFGIGFGYYGGWGFRGGFHGRR